MTDEVRIIITRPDDLVIPNVVTSDGDGKNDHFLLPANIEKSSLLIFNRWGERIFDANEYQNDWPIANVGTGVYFYILQGECTPELKGVIHVMN